jgi:chemotaxis protein methyltransferase CheR
MSAAIESVAKMLRRESGMTIGAERMPALAAAVERVAGGLGSAALLGDRPDPELLERLVDEVTVNETFFFRHVGELEAVDWTALAAAARAAGRREVRVWSAGCATGEEAYTLAILACEAFATPRPPVAVLASDISPRALELARAGVYRARSVRGVPRAQRERWLAPTEDAHAVSPMLRQLVRFERHNLVHDPVPAPASFDLIACRNVLIYFEPATAAAVRASLAAALSPGGSLVLGAADRLCAWADAPPPPRAPRPTAAPTSRAAPRRASPQALAAALAGTDRGRADEAIAVTDDALAADPMAAQAHFVRGVAELVRGEPAAAAAALRRALYLDPAHAVAAFKLGRTYDTLSEPVAARRAYRRALEILDSHPATRTDVPDGVDADDVRSACFARFEALGGGRPRGGRR